VALLPSLILFAAILFSLFTLTRSDAESDVRERGRLASVAIAQSIQYDVVSGNYEGLGAALERFLERDPTLALITIRNQDRMVIAEAGSVQSVSVLERLDTPIQRDVPTLNLFDGSPSEGGQLLAPSGNPAVIVPQMEQSTGRTTPASQLGSVEVSVHVAPLLDGRMKRALYALTIVGFVALTCLLLGLVLAQRVRRPFAQVMTSLREIREGRFDAAKRPVTSTGEIGDLEQIVNGIADSMNRSHNQLEREVEVRTENLRTVQSALYESNQERGAVLARTNMLIEDERRKLSHEIHDRFNADLVAMKHAVQRVSDGLHRKVVWLDSTATRYALIKDLDQLENSVSGLYTTARGIVKSLRPEALDTLGLEQALRELVGQFERDNPQCNISFETEPKLLAIQGNVAITTYRVVQECLANIAKHAEAKNVTISVTPFRDRKAITICVRDDGKGFDVDAPRQIDSLGLIAIRERADSVNGRVRVTSSNEGTQVCLDVPSV
jgi:two-component system, NarL family, sensor histidine kinase UhpB